MGPSAAVPEDHARPLAEVLSINFLGVVNTCHAILPSMVERKQGAIVNISSDTGRVGSFGEAIYASSKAAIMAFSKTLAREHARDNIRVNVVSPGLCETPLIDRNAAGRIHGKDSRLDREFHSLETVGRTGRDRADGPVSGVGIRQLHHGSGFQH